jgi:putative membrane protein
MRVFSFLFLVLFVAALGLFAYQNSQSVDVTYRVPNVFDVSRQVSFPLLALLLYLLGMFTGWAVVGMLRRSWRRVAEGDHARRSA